MTNSHMAQLTIVKELSIMDSGNKNEGHIRDNILFQDCLWYNLITTLPEPLVHLV